MSDFIGGYSDSSSNEVNIDFEDNADGTDEFEIDDSLPLIDKIQKYINSDVVLHREFSEVAKQKYEDVNFTLLPIIEEVVSDIEPVIRQALVEQIPQVTQSLLENGSDAGYSKILHTLLPIVAQLTTDRNPQVRMSAIETLQEMAKLIKYEDLEPHLIPFIRSLVNDSTEEEHRVQAANLCHNLSPILGGQLTKQIILPFVSKLASDPSFRVRKAIAGNLGNICQTIGIEETTNFLLPIFIALSKDEIWSVRKGCAEVLIIVSQNVSPIERYSKLIQPSRWVNNAAFQNLGPFIATFDGSQVTPKLLKYFTDMIYPTNIRFPDSDLITHCAYNFPAVLYTVGSVRWSELSETYHTLVSDTNWKVRRSLSHSIHEIAKILGPVETKNSLLPTFNLFLQDLDEVKVGVIRHFAEFLTCLDSTLREDYIDTLHGFISDPNKWRFRKLISKQIGTMCSLFNLKTILTQIAPKLLTLLNDPVSKVRNYAATGVGNLIIKIQESKNENSNISNNNNNNNNNNNSESTTTTEEDITELKNSFLSKIKAFASEPSFSNRQVLADDPVPNVRLVTAEVLVQNIITHNHFSNIPSIEDALTKLNNDSDLDVKYFSAKSTNTVNIENQQQQQQQQQQQDEEITDINNQQQQEPQPEQNNNTSETTSETTPVNNIDSTQNSDQN
eukprot:gene4640-5797_t